MVYNRRMNKVIAGIEGVCKIVDDILIHVRSLTLSVLKKRACPLLDRCRQHGATLSEQSRRFRLLKLISVDFASQKLAFRQALTYRSLSETYLDQEALLILADGLDK